MRTTSLPDGTLVPVIGQGTHRLGENVFNRNAERAILKGISYGMILIDTAEAYANGGAERIVGDVISQRHDDVFVVTKVLPQNIRTMRAACERSLERLHIPIIDLYLLHWWRNTIPNLDYSHVPLAEIIASFRDLQITGKIKRWGVSNFNLEDMKSLLATGGTECSANEVLYNLANRNAEYALPWYQEHKIPLIAHSPFGWKEKVLARPILAQIAERHDATPAQIALAWIIRHPGVIAVPKADRPSHTRDNAQAAEIKLTQEDYANLEWAFPRYENHYRNS